MYEGTRSRESGRKIVAALPGVVTCVAAALGSAGASVATAPHPGDGRYSYSYYKERRPLHLDTGRFAVLAATDADGAAAGPPDLSGYGLEGSTVSPMVVRGWSFVETTAAIRTEDAIEAAASQIAEDGPVEFVSPVFVDDRGGPIVITPHILVGFDRNLDAARAEQIVAGSGAGRIVDRDWANMKRTYRLESASRDGFETLRAANELAERPEVIFAEPDMMVTGRAEWIPDDAYFPYLWGLHNDGTFPLLCDVVPDFDLDAPEAWDVTIGDPSIVVAVLDVGVQQDHHDLNLYTPGFDATGEGGGGGPINACDNHGTPVAGCISGIIDNVLGIVGVAPGVKSASVRIGISNPACDNSFFTQESWVVESLAWAESIGARITNNSWKYNSGPAPASVAQKFADTREAGMVHFAAAGNDSLGTLPDPAALPDVNAVSALEPCGELAPFSNWGEGLAFSAPGHYIIGTDRTGTDGYNDGIDDGGCLPSGGPVGCDADAECPPGETCFQVSLNYALVAGTSFASPYAAGVAALALSINPELTADQIEWVLQQSAVDYGDPGYDIHYGWGFVNAFNAVQLVQSGTPGEAAELRVTDVDPISGDLSLSYLPACGSSSHDVYYGPLDQSSTYGWSGATCGIGDSGEYDGFDPGPGSYFFVLVGNGDADDVEGSYGTDGAGNERPAAGTAYCGRTQQLVLACQ